MLFIIYLKILKDFANFWQQHNKTHGTKCKNKQKLSLPHTNKIYLTYYECFDVVVCVVTGKVKFCRN